MVTLTEFSRSHQHFEMSYFDQNNVLCMISLDLAKLNVLYHCFKM